MKLAGNTVAHLLYQEVCKAKEFCGEEGYEISCAQKREIADELAAALMLTTGGAEHPQGGSHSKLYRLRHRRTQKTGVIAAALCPNCYPLVQVRHFPDEEQAAASTRQEFSRLPNVVYPLPPRS